MKELPGPRISLKRLGLRVDKYIKVYPVLWRAVSKILLIAVLGGLTTATLVRTAPGYGLSEEQLDLRRGRGSLQRAETRRAGESDVLRFYGKFLVEYAQGRLGDSPLFGRPAGQLIAERTVPTAGALAAGLTGGWVLALAAGIPAGLRLWPAVEWPAWTLALLLQSVPAAVLGLGLLVGGARGAIACAGALTLVLYPRLVQYVMNLVREAAAQPHVLTARAKGLGERRVVTRHVLPVVLPELLALAGISVSMALSAAIPLEMILDVAGIGQLAWQAALGRDLNLLVNLTVLISIVISLSNAMAGWMGALALGERGAKA